MVNVYVGSSQYHWWYELYVLQTSKVRDGV